MVSGRPAQSVFTILFLLVFVPAACGDRTGDTPAEDKSRNENNSSHVDWGIEINLDKMVAMAKEGQIEEIDWHVMPNILLARTSDGRIFHIKNENKGVDLRSTLVKAGVKTGEGGILFKHFF